MLIPLIYKCIVLWLIDCFGFYAVSAIFQPCNGRVLWRIYRISGYLRVMFCPQILVLNRVLNLREWISRNTSESFKIHCICMIMSYLRDWIFHNFDTLANISENGCTRKKPDKRYITYYMFHVIVFEKEAFRNWTEANLVNIGSAYLQTRILRSYLN